MNNATQQIVNKAWHFAHVLRDGGLPYMAYTAQITFLLFLKTAHEQTLPPHKRAPIVPPKLGWERGAQYPGMLQNLPVGSNKEKTC